MTLEALAVRRRFTALDGRIYLNAASEGPMPANAIQEAVRVATLKERPWEIGSEYYYQVPAKVRTCLEIAIGAPAGTVALVGGTSAGIGLAARGLPVSFGDEVLLLEGQFPSNVFPWRSVLERGGTVRVVERPFGSDPTEAILSAIRPATRIVSIDWVNFVDGAVVDLQAVGAACRQAGAFFVVDAAQGLGALPLDVSTLGIDVLAAPAHKWLLGPVGLGFVYVSPTILDVLQPWNSGWVNLSSRTGFRNLLRLDGVPPPDATRFETGSPAYSLLSPWTLSLQLLAEIGPDATQRHVLGLAGKATAGLMELADGGSRGPASALPDRGSADRLTNRTAGTSPTGPDAGARGGLEHGRSLRVLSPVAGSLPTEGMESVRHAPLRSGIVAFEAGDRTLPLFRALEAGGITVALREGAIRISPHVYNTEAEIEEFLAAVRRFLH